MAVLIDAQGSRIARFIREVAQGSIVVRGLTPGEHGMHLHDNGTCDPPDFASAGGIVNLRGKHHGFENPQGPREGDLPNLKVGKNGTAEQFVSLKTSYRPLVHYQGGAFIIHADPDDQATDPEGKSGARILCGIFFASQ